MRWRSARLLTCVVVAAAHVAVAAPAAPLAAQPATARSAAAESSVATPTGRRVRPAAVPFGVGEVLTYRASFGGLPVGTARLTVVGIDTVRGRLAWHLTFTIDGGPPFFRVHDRYESWVDVETLASLRYHQRIREGGYQRRTNYEILAESGQYRKNDEPLQPTVRRPLDDGSFLYAVRVDGVRVGEVIRDDRYFVPDRNPVVLTGLRRDTVKVGAGRFPTIVVKPAIKTKGIFAEDGEAQVWFSDDADRFPVQVKSSFAGLSLSLSLQTVVRGTRLDPEVALPAP
jgi:hypothetical protein